VVILRCRPEEEEGAAADRAVVVTMVEVVVSERVLALGMGQPMVLLIPWIPPRR